MIRVIILLCLAAVSAFASGPLKLEDIFLNETYTRKAPGSIQWTESDSLRWLENGKIYERSAAGGEAKSVELPGSVTGQDILDFIQAPGDTGILVYTAENNYWLLPDRDPILLPEGTRHLFSHSGMLLAYVRGGNIFLYDPGKGERAVTSDGSDNLINGSPDWVYEEEFGLYEGMIFSPDDSMLLFFQFDETEVPRHPIPDYEPLHAAAVQQSYPLAGDPNPMVRLGVAGLEDGQLSWIESFSGDEYIPRATFTADGKNILLHHLDRAQQELMILSHSLSMSATDMLTGEKSESWINVEDKLFPLADGGFIRTSEMEGYRHLYRYASDGGQGKALTGGKWEVSSVDWVSESGNEVIYTAARPSSRERQVYYLDALTGREARLTESPGWHSVTVSPDGRYLLDRFSSWDTPEQLWILDRVSHRKTFWYDTATESFSTTLLPVREDLSIPTRRDYTLTGTLLRPKTLEKDRDYPVLVYVYGGPHAQVTSNRWGTSNLWFSYMVQNGYLVFMLDNRGSAGRGKAWENELYREFGKKELEDQVSGVTYLKSLSFVDPDRIGIWGWSYGGYLTLYALAHSGNFSMGMAVAPVTDWRYYDSIYTERYLKLPDGNPEGYRNSSPIHDAAQIRVPLLMVHGTNDDNVHIQNTYAFTRNLVEAGVDFELMVYAGKQHSLRGKETRFHLFRKLAEFTKKNL